MLWFKEYDPYRFFAHAVLLVDNRPSRNGEKLPEQWTAEFPGLDHLMRAVPPWSDLTSQHGVTTKQSPLGTPCVRIKRRTGTWRRKGPQSTAKVSVCVAKKRLKYGGSPVQQCVNMTLFYM